MNLELDTSYIKATLAPILHLLEDDNVNEVAINPLELGTGIVWVKLGNGNWQQALSKTGDLIILDNTKLQQIISFMSGSNDKITHDKRPILECSIPLLGYRFTGVMQPASIGCHIFNIRKFSTTLYTFEDYVKQGLFLPEYIEVIREWQKNNFSIAIVGGVDSGKTTFICSFIEEKRKLNPDECWVVLEDTKELRIRDGNIRRLLTTNQVTMDDHLKVMLRLTPDQTVVGEVRGKEAYTALKLMQTGKPVIFSMHANSVDRALVRFEHMCLEHNEVDKISRQEIANSLTGIISIQKETYKTVQDGQIIVGFKRKVTGIREVIGYDDEFNKYAYRDVL